MSRSVNKVTLIGHIGKDAETRYTPSGKAVSKFSVATERRWKESGSDEYKAETEWTNVVLWQQEGVAPYLLKGTQVYIDGRLQTHSYEDKDGRKVYVTEVVANEVILLGSKGQGENVEPRRTAAKPKLPYGNNGPRSRGSSVAISDSLEVTDDDVPF